MSELLWEVFELLITLFECAVSMHFVCRFVGMDSSIHHSRKHWLALTLCYSLTVVIMNLLTPFEGVYVLIYSGVVFLYTMIFMHGSVIKKAVASIMFLCIIIMNSSLGVNLISSLMHLSVSDIYTESGITRIITLVIVQSLNLLVFQILEKTICAESLSLRKQEWLLFGSVLFLSILCFTLIQIVAVRIQIEKTIRFCFIGADLSLIYINFVTIRLLSMLHRQQQTELENSQMKMQLKYQAKYADSVQRQEETVCKLRHDLKTTISALRNFQINRKYDEMGEYLQAYDKTLSATESIVNTNQSFVNAILNTKISYAKEHGIICSCHSPKQLPEFAGEDYCSLLGNLLDNAIEASVTLISLSSLRPQFQ